MRREIRLSGIMHGLLYLCAARGPVSGNVLGEYLGANPVLIYRFMSLLRNAGIVTATRGVGWWLIKRPEEVTALDVHEALGRPILFTMVNCPVQPRSSGEHCLNAMLDRAYAAAEAALNEELGRITLADLMAETSPGIAMAPFHVGASHARC